MERAATRPEREALLAAEGYPAYTTSAGWLGYDDEKLRRRCRERRGRARRITQHQHVGDWRV